MLSSRRAWLTVLGMLALLLPAPSTQAATPGAKVQVPVTTSPKRYPDVGFDAQNNVYLAVIGNSTVQGRFIAADGTLLAGPFGSGTFTISSTSSYHQSPRVACGGGVCAVFWGGGDPTFPTVRLVSYTNGWVSDAIKLTTTYGLAVELGHGITYASGDNEFVAAWVHSGSLKFARISLGGQLLQSTVVPAAAGFKSGGYVAYNPVLDEVLISFAGTRVVNGVEVAFVAVQRVQNGSFIGSPIDLATGGSTYLPHGEFNPVSDKVLVAYYKSGKFYGREVGAGGALGPVVLLANTAAYDAIDLAFNTTAGRFLFVTHGPNIEDVAFEISPAIVPSAAFTLTSNGGTGNFNPRVVSHSSQGQWLAVMSNSFKSLWGQFAVNTASGGSGGTPPPPPPPPNPAAAVTAAEADFTGDNLPDLVWRHSSGGLSVWRMSGLTATALLSLGPAVGSDWKVAGTGDLNGDGKPEVLWQHTDRWLLAWFMNGQNVASSVYLSPAQVDSVKWKVAALADVNADNKADILWQHDDGWLAVWYMNGTTVASTAYLSPPSIADKDWRLAGAGDLNGDGKPDLVWRHSISGFIGAWMMNGGAATSTVLVSPAQIGLDWQIGAVVDLNADGKSDLVWKHSGGSVGVWLMNGATATSMSNLTPGAVSSGWTMVGPH